MKSIALAATLSLALLTLGACGSSQSDRALSGGAIGAGVGAVGAGTGALTARHQINLGRPIWR